MPLPGSGPISFSQVNTELGRAAGANLGMNDAGVRNLAGVSSGAISMSQLHGKAANPTLSATGTGGGSCYYNTQQFMTSCTVSGTLSCTVTGGIGPFTYTWEYVSGSLTTLSTPYQASTNWSRTSDEGSYSGTYRCRVTDGRGVNFYSNNVETDSLHQAFY